MLFRFAVLAFAAIFAFSPSGRISMTNERGVLLLHLEIDGVGPLLFIFDPGAPDILTTYGESQLRGKPLFPVLSGDPEQLDPKHDPSSGTIAGSIGPALLQRYAVRIDYANAAITLIPFRTVASPLDPHALAMRVDAYEMPTVAAAVDGIAGRFEIDVRAPHSMLFTPFVREHAFREEEAHRIGLGRYVVRDSTVRLSRASQGKFASAGVAGLIGNDVLSKFIVTLDYHRNVVLVER
jgi:hypothetical protein